MARIEDMTGIGIPGEQAEQIAGRPATVAAAGSAIGDATLVTGSVVKVTGADGSKGVRLPLGSERSFVPDTILISNTASSALKVYPGGSSENINGLSDGANVTIAANTSGFFTRYDADTWISDQTS